MNFRPVSVFITALLISGCTTWTPAQKAKLAQIELVPATGANAVYKEPDATLSPGIAEFEARQGAGILPVLAGGILDLGVMTFQQVRFELAESKRFEELKQALRSPPAGNVDAAVHEVLNVDPFFRSRLAPSAPTKLAIRITKFGLSRSPIPDSDVLLRVSIEAEVKITDGKDELYFGTLIGRGKRAASAENLLKDPGYVEAGYREAAQDLAAMLVLALDEKVGQP